MVSRSAFMHVVLTRFVGEEVEDMMMEDIDTEGYDSKEAPVDVTDKNVEQLKVCILSVELSHVFELRGFAIQGLADKQKLAPLIESAERKAEARKAAKASKS
eukprot:748895-Hanusia_phi.AAC.2